MTDKIGQVNYVQQVIASFSGLSNRVVKLDGSGYGQTTTQLSTGISKFDFSSGELVVLETIGSWWVEKNGSITFNVGDIVYSDSNGLAVATGTASQEIGVCLSQNNTHVLVRLR